MMIDDFATWLAQCTLLVSAAIVIVAAARSALKRLAGPAIAYWIWLLIPISVLTSLIPNPPRTARESQTFSEMPSIGFDSAGFAEIVSPSVIFVALLIWVTGVFLMLAFMIHQHRTLTRLLGTITTDSEGLHQSSENVGPMLVGVWRPTIVVPADFRSRFTQEEQRFAIQHEQEHRLRRDPLINGLAAVALCVFWFSPLSYWAYRRFRLDQEVSCDSRVISRIGASRREYANTLLKTQVASEASMRVDCFSCGWRSLHPLKERIIMLKRTPPSRFHRRCGYVATGALIILVSHALWAAQAPEVTPSNNTPTIGSKFEIAADEMTQLVAGVTRLTGNVSIRGVDSKTNLNADKVISNVDRSADFEGHVQISRNEIILRADKAKLTAEGVLVADVAYLITTRP